MRLLPVVAGVWCIQRRFLMSCSYLVQRPSGVILIDSGIDARGTDVRFALDHLGLSVADVRAILMTHWHNDHSAGAAAIQRESGARIYYHADGHDRFTRRARARGIRGWIARHMPGCGPLGPLRALLELAPPEAVEADQLVKEGDVVESGFRVIETPGHESGHVSFMLEPEGILFAGDALAVVKDRVAFLSSALTSDSDAARRSMLRCIDEAPRVICPGHRYALVDPRPEEFTRIRTVLEGMTRWPLIGC